jgi:hypothetical protein
LAVDSEGCALRALACVAGVLGGVCWVVGAFLAGGVADAVIWTGLGVLSIAAFGAGTRIAGGSLVLLRAVVGVGCVALGWSVVAAAVSELPRSGVVGVVGVLALLLALVLLVRRPVGTRQVGAHAR